MPLADFTQNIFHGNFGILEIELYGRRSFDTHFMFFGSLCKWVRTSFYNKASEFIAIHFGKNCVHLRKTAIGDPAFLPVQ